MAELFNDNSSHVAKRVSKRAPKNDIPIWFLVACFILDPTSPSGLRWRFRPDMSKQWNTRWARKPAGHFDGRGWSTTLTVDGRVRSLKAHRIIYALTNGFWPPDEVDHQDRTPTNNRLTNLREATRGQNEQNKGLRSDNGSGFKGSWDKQWRKWNAYISVDERRINRGYFIDILDAIVARTNAEIEHHPFRVPPRLDADIFVLPPGLPAEDVEEWRLDVRRAWQLPPRIHWRP
jgi:HNH endonuclease